MRSTEYREANRGDSGLGIGDGEDPKGAKVQIGVQSTEYGVRRDAKTVRRCKSERCSCGKVGAGGAREGAGGLEYRGKPKKITEYGGRITEGGIDD